MRSLRLVRILLELMTREGGMTRDELLAAPTLRASYSSIHNAAVQQMRRDLKLLAGDSSRRLQQRALQPVSSASAGSGVAGASALLQYDAATARYSLATDTMTLLRLSSAELDALCVLAYAFHGGQTILGGREFFKRLRAALPEEQRQSLDVVLRGNALPPSLVKLDLQLPILEDAQVETLHLLQQAMRERRTVDFAYQPTSRAGEQQAAPTMHYGDAVEEIRADAAHVYVSVWCEEAPTPGVLDLRLERFVAGSIKLQPKQAREHQRYFPQVRYCLARRIAQGGVTEWLEQQQVEMQEDGSAIVSGRARSLFWARQLLLKYGENARALDPPRLVEMMRAAVEGMRAVYAEGENGNEKR